VSGPGTVPYTIWLSTNLTDWVAAGTNRAIDGVLRCDNTTNGSAFFFRVSIAP
jgi:hypothetical protein